MAMQKYMKNTHTLTHYCGSGTNNFK